ncbi:MAG: hypothetical protein ACJAY8_000187 [Sphingobacteriales bacterium]|jgi:hypothetical protein
MENRSLAMVVMIVLGVAAQQVRTMMESNRSNSAVQGHVGYTESDIEVGSLMLLPQYKLYR